MMIEQVIVHRIAITRIGQRVSFQVRLPQDTRRLIGLEYDARKISGQAFPGGNPLALLIAIEEEEGGDEANYFIRNKNKLIGKLSLQNNYCENLFYRGDLVEDRNHEQYEGIAAQGFTPQPWIQHTKREEIGISVKPGLIQGLFEDSYGKDEYEQLTYELNLYFWIQKCVT